MKTCARCKKEFPATLEYFYKNGPYLGYCKICTKEKQRLWDKNNAKEKQEYNKLYFEKNKEKKKEYSKRWRDNNTEAGLRGYHRRRAKKKNNGYEYYTNDQVLELYGTNCYLCDMPINLKVSGKSGSNPQWKSGLHIEHFIDIALGGPDTLENVRPSHAWCNLTKAPKINN